MKIEISLKIILLFISLILMYSVNLYSIFFISIILHEFSHALLGVCMGLKIRKVKVNPLGINLEFMSFREKYRISKKICIYLAGPIFNFILAYIGYKLNIEYNLKINIVYTNLILGIFNLLPVLPLDGGKIVREILNYYIGYKNSSVVILNISKVILIILSLVYSILIFKLKNVFIFFVIIYLWYLYFLEEKKLSTIIKVYNILENV